MSGPQAELEAAVQRRAAHLALDMSAEAGRSALRALVAEEVRAWNAEHDRGDRTASLWPPEAVTERAMRNLASYGPLTDLLADSDVWEIMVNAPDLIFVRRHQGPSGYHPEVFHDDDHVVRTLTRLLEDSSASHRKLDPAEGLQDAQLDDGSRIHIAHHDISRGGHLMANIRRFTGVAIRSLDELVERSTLDRGAAALLRRCVRGSATVLIAGEPGAGKTTLLSCCAAELDPSRRVVIAEEVFEADVPQPNVASLQTRPARQDRPAIDLRRLVAGFLRMAPDVAIVGEVRDREALPLLLTLSSGVSGLTTIHASDARGALRRLRFVCQLAEEAANIPMSALNALVTDTIDLVVHCRRSADGPRVCEIAAVEEMAGPAGSAELTLTQLFVRQGPDAPLSPTGQMPQRLTRRMATAGIDIAEVLR